MLRPALFALLLTAGPAQATDGNADTTFSADGKASYVWPANTLQAETETVAAAADGGVITAGWYSYSNSQQHFALFVSRFRGNGELDTAFANQGIAQIDFQAAPRVAEFGRSVFALPDGNVLLFASLRTAEGSSPELPALVRLNADGQPDSSFGAGGKRLIDISGWPVGASLSMTAAALQRDGKLVAVGHCDGCGGVPAELDMVALRVLSDGSLDPGFGSGGWTRVVLSGLQSAGALAIDDLGRITMAGMNFTGTQKPVLTRLTSAGLVDSSYGMAGTASPPCPVAGQCSVAALATGRTLGSFFVRRTFLALNRNGGGGVLALDNDGDVVTSFADAGYLALDLEEGSSVQALLLDHRARLLIGGTIDPNGSGVTDFLVARSSFGGDLDASFDGNGLARFAFDSGSASFDRATAMTLSARRPVLAGTLVNVGATVSSTGVLRLQSDELFVDGFQ
jgi:uncharacterized delta-60 repeat protein